MSKATFAATTDADLTGYVVWVPMLGGKAEHVPAATRLVPDNRAAHYWDESGVLMRLYDQTLGLGQSAWDIYMVYAPGVRWNESAPPKPSYWMHQLGKKIAKRTGAPLLDAETFGLYVRNVLKQQGTQPVRLDETAGGR